MGVSFCNRLGCSKPAALSYQVGESPIYSYCTEECRKIDQQKILGKLKIESFEIPMQREIQYLPISDSTKLQQVAHPILISSNVGMSSSSSSSSTLDKECSTEGNSSQPSHLDQIEKELEAVISLYQEFAAAGCSNEELQGFWNQINQSPSFPLKLLKHAIQIKNYPICLIFIHTGAEILNAELWNESGSFNLFALDIMEFVFLRTSSSETLDDLRSNLGISPRDQTFLQDLLHRVERKSNSPLVEALRAKVNRITREQKGQSSKSSVSLSSCSSSSAASSNTPILSTSLDPSMKKALEELTKMYTGCRPQNGVADQSLFGLCNLINSEKGFADNLMKYALQTKDIPSFIILLISEVNLLDYRTSKHVTNLILEYAPKPLKNFILEVMKTVIETKNLYVVQLLSSLDIKQFGIHPSSKDIGELLNVTKRYLPAEFLQIAVASAGTSLNNLQQSGSSSSVSSSSTSSSASSLFNHRGLVPEPSLQSSSNELEFDEGDFVGSSPTPGPPLQSVYNELEIGEGDLTSQYATMSVSSSSTSSNSMSRETVALAPSPSPQPSQTSSSSTSMQTEDYSSVSDDENTI